MVDAPTDRIPLHTTLLPLLGLAAWTGFGKTGLGPLALLLTVVLVGNVLAAVQHAEVIVIGLGEPRGTGVAGDVHIFHPLDVSCSGEPCCGPATSYG